LANQASFIQGNTALITDVDFSIDGTKLHAADLRPGGGVSLTRA
jgi:hypothetical protein